MIDGVRYSIPGDWVRVEADGTLTLLGRGSNCINTAGEKVYPEEVEEALKAHAGVSDALVVGIADPKWGQAITAVVQLTHGTALDELELKEFRAHAHRRLQGAETDPRESRSGAGAERQGRLQTHPRICAGATAWLSRPNRIGTVGATLRWHASQPRRLSRR